MADPADIRNWRRRPDGITTSGKLEPGDPARLAAIGVRHVINLALDDHPEALADEAAALAAEGIGYTHIPVPFDAPTRDHVARLDRALAEAAALLILQKKFSMALVLKSQGEDI